MKKYKSLFLSLMLVAPVIVSILGCKKFLDRKPLTATLSDFNQGALEAKSFGLYSTLRDYAGFSTLPWIDFHSIRDDDAQKGSSLTDGAEVNTEFETFQYTKDDWATNSYWSDHYYMINLTNEILHLADSLKATDPASQRNVGEALFFRAYSYSELVKTYGEVPLIDFFYTDASQGVKPKSPVADIYALIDADLTKATQYLPLNWEVAGTNIYPGRLTSGAAKTLWAQTYLFRQNWGPVIALCNDVIASGQYKLSPNFVDIWKDGLNGNGKNGPAGAAQWLNHRILRYADVLLMLAEAANETGDGATAENMLEQVRARARGDNSAVLPHIAFANQAQMRTAIKNERRWEFAMEGYRFYDLVRWGDAIGALGSLGYTNRCRYYPIPQQAINISGGVLVQNPEW